MTYKIKEEPKQIYYAVTHQFILIDCEGKEYEIRKWEDSNEGGYYLLNGENNWIDFIPDEEMEEFINDEMGI